MFAGRERDAMNLGLQPIPINLPDDLPAVQRVVAEDVLYLARGVRPRRPRATTSPYSQRCRDDVPTSATARSAGR